MGCTVPLHCSPALFPCPVPLHCSPALFPCTVPLHCSSALFPCTVPQHCSPALFPCTVPLHCSPSESSDNDGESKDVDKNKVQFLKRRINSLLIEHRLLMKKRAKLMATQ